MVKLTPVSKESHADRSWNRVESYGFASRNNLAPLVGAEITRATLTLPMAFVRNQDHFSLVAVLSPLPDQNLFVAPNGRWLGGYVPSAFRGYPFRLARAKGRDDMLLCIDENSGYVRNDDKGEPFFDEDGDISGPVKNVLDFLSKVEQNRVETDRAVMTLAQAKLFTEWPLKIKDKDQEKTFSGLYRIDESAMDSLEDEAFLNLKKHRAFRIAYAQLLSMDNIRVFEKLAGIRKQVPAKEPDIKAVFGDDDIINFG
jgi:hypothetical protein